ncbi:MAG: hypothetical protein ACOYL8_01875 [Patescibacteria group bacterium]
MLSYRSILKQAWSIVWNHKYLWFFGLFASLAIAGGSMEYQFITQTFGQGIIDSSYQGLNTLLAINEFCQLVWFGIINLAGQNFLVIINAITILLLTLTLIAVFVWLAISSQAALVDNVKKILSSKKKISNLTVREGLTIGNTHFWSVLGLNILIKLLISFAFFIISLPLLFMVMSTNYAFVIAYTILFVIFVPVSVSLSLIIKYAISCRVLENKSLVQSMEKAYSIFKKNWLISLEIALILFIISFVSTALILIIAAIIFFPFLWLSLIFSLTWLSFLVLFLCLVFIVTFGSILTTFQITVWTDLYLHLKENNATAKLERIFQKK